MNIVKQLGKHEKEELDIKYNCKNNYLLPGINKLNEIVVIQFLCFETEEIFWGDQEINWQSRLYQNKGRQIQSIDDDEEATENGD